MVGLNLCVQKSIAKKMYVIYYGGNGFQLLSWGLGHPLFSC